MQFAGANDVGTHSAINGITAKFKEKKRNMTEPVLDMGNAHHREALSAALVASGIDTVYSSPAAVGNSIVKCQDQCR